MNEKLIAATVELSAQLTRDSDSGLVRTEARARHLAESIALDAGLNADEKDALLESAVEFSRPYDDLEDEHDPIASGSLSVVHHPPSSENGVHERFLDGDSPSSVPPRTAATPPPTAVIEESSVSTRANRTKRRMLDRTHLLASLVSLLLVVVVIDISIRRGGRPPSINLGPDTQRECAAARGTSYDAGTTQQTQPHQHQAAGATQDAGAALEARLRQLTDAKTALEARLRQLTDAKAALETEVANRRQEAAQSRHEYETNLERYQSELDTCRRQSRNQE